MRQLILASASPRRRELLEMAGYTFCCIPAKGDEQKRDGESSRQTALRLSLEKAREISALHPGAVVLGSDTMVAIDNQLLGKPADEKQARAMLCTLSGKTHTVWTGVTITDGVRTLSFVSHTAVTFYPLTGREIYAYLQTGEPMDKAGAYGIQGRGSLLIQKIHGDFYTVMGLPVAAVSRALNHFGIHPSSAKSNL